MDSERPKDWLIQKRWGFGKRLDSLKSKHLVMSKAMGSPKYWRLGFGKRLDLKKLKPMGLKKYWLTGMRLDFERPMDSPRSKPKGLLKLKLK